MDSPLLLQQTLTSSFHFHGVGIHTGAMATVRVYPADADMGRVFRIGSLTVPAQVEYVVDTRRCTTLGKDGATLHTVEHLLSALHAFQIDNALIEVDGPEIPILDGSALPFAQAIAHSGILPQTKPVHVLRLRNAVEVIERGSKLRALPADVFALTARTEFENWTEGEASQTLVLNPDADAQYLADIAPARTFAFRQEVEQLLAMGLARGGSLDNALIITPPDEFSSPLRVPQEWCAHKLLDLLGDLALVNARLEFSVTALRPGHGVNVALARALLREGVQVTSSD